MPLTPVCGSDICLPAEIVDTILDQLGILAFDSRQTPDETLNRRATLGSCALTCKSWLPRCRYHLFREVHLPPNDIERCTAFSALITNPFCTIIPYVRTLIIREAIHPIGMGVLWFNDALPHLSLLPNVQTLAIFGARFDRISSPTGVPFFTHMKSVTELHLTGCQFRSPDQCLDALAACQSLQKLVIRRTSLDILLGFNLRLDPLPCPPPHLTSLSLDSHRMGPMGNYDSIMRWIGQTAAGYKPKVTKLVLERVTDTEYLTVAHFLQNVGPTLEFLDILVVDLDTYDTHGAFCRHVDLKHNTSLQSIAFDQLLICEPYPARLEIAKYVPLILKTIQSPMKEVILRVSINTPEDLDVIEWDDIIATIQKGSNWRSLERIMVSGPRKEILKQSEEWLKRRLDVLKGSVSILCTLLPSPVDTIIMDVRETK